MHAQAAAPPAPVAAAPAATAVPPQLAAAALQQLQPQQVLAVMVPCAGCRQLRAWDSMAVDSVTGIEWRCAQCRGTGGAAAGALSLPQQARLLSVSRSPCICNAGLA